MTDTPNLDFLTPAVREQNRGALTDVLRIIEPPLKAFEARDAAQRRVAVASSRVTDAEQVAAPIRAEYEVWRARLADAEAKVAAARAELAEADAALKAVR
ncbi:hypothetical protein J5Y09_04105 [Roseomonas sp. PWR1]|uniref:Serine--tRNA ligase n=1 Tax=Roseomonas nitratireducens TaxID=2820810 RepID=A0ABS4ANY8_9PROT|nr:hypothetical protein [Neoroseomonas nitratireducens]MBP0463084.1 hypothetical protein [Neoroseomonas nitratireducens]